MECLNLSVYYCTISWVTPESSAGEHYPVLSPYRIYLSVCYWGTLPSPLTLQNLFVSVLLGNTTQSSHPTEFICQCATGEHYPILSSSRIYLSVYYWGTLPNPLTLQNIFVSVLLGNITQSSHPTEYICQCTTGEHYPILSPYEMFFFSFFLFFCQCITIYIYLVTPREFTWGTWNAYSISVLLSTAGIG